MMLHYRYGMNHLAEYAHYAMQFKLFSAFFHSSSPIAIELQALLVCSFNVCPWSSLAFGDDIASLGCYKTFLELSF